MNVLNKDLCDAYCFVSLCSIAEVRGGVGIRARRAVREYIRHKLEHLAAYRRSGHHVLCRDAVVTLYCSERKDGKQSKANKGKNGHKMTGKGEEGSRRV